MYNTKLDVIYVHKKNEVTCPVLQIKLIIFRSKVMKLTRLNEKLLWCGSTHIHITTIRPQAMVRVMAISKLEFSAKIDRSRYLQCKSEAIIVVVAISAYDVGDCLRRLSDRATS